MLKNRIIVKKIRNIFILLMAIIIMLGAYHNIRNSRAENVIQVELEVADKSDILSTQTVTVDATETSDGNYLVNLPISVNENVVTKYYTSSGEEILVDSENNIATMQLTEEEITDKKVQLQTDYDTKEVTINDETKTFYKKELTNKLGLQETTQEESNIVEEQTENQDVVVTGYMPIDAELEVKEIDLATLTEIKLPNEEQSIQKAYEFSIYQIVETPITEDNTTNEEETQTEVASTQTERIEYDPSVYEEKITVKTQYEQANVTATIYELEDENEIVPVASTTAENREYISFETEKTDKTIKYIIATEEIKSEDNATEIEDNVSKTQKNEDNIVENEDNITEDEIIESNEVKNSKWEVVETQNDIPNRTATIVVKGPEDILTEDFINVIINGKTVNEGITKKIDNKEKVSDGIKYTIILTDLPADTNQIKIGLINPYAVSTMALSTEDGISDESDIMLTATTYNALVSASSETSETSAFLGNSSVQRKNVENVTFGDESDLGRGLRRNFSAINNTGSGHSSSSTTWKDIYGVKDGTLNGGTWGTDYLQFDGVDDWVNLGRINYTTVTLDATIILDQTSTDHLSILDNFEYGGFGLHIANKRPYFTVYITGTGYVDAIASSELAVGVKTRLTGTFDGKTLSLYINGKLAAQKTVSGTYGAPLNNTVMAIGVNPKGDQPIEGQFPKMKVYSVKIHNTALTADEVAKSVDINGQIWDVSASKDKSIKAWTRNLSTPHTVYIGSENEIYGNQNSSYLFSYVGYSNICTATNTITNLNLLNVSNVTNMRAMFSRFGYRSMKSLDLGSAFDTSKVTDMSYMFDSCGYKVMTSLSLGSNFNTSKVTNMYSMFIFCGQNAMTSLSLGDNFNTEKVTNMGFMFDSCGYKVMTSLKLGSKFYTSQATNMTQMFYETGNTAMTTLDLGPAFTKIADTNTNMFANCGKTGAVIYAPESIYKDRTSFKKSSTDTSTASGAIAVTSGRTVNSKYKPEWTVTGTTVDKTAKSLQITLKGAVNTSNYTSNVTTALKTSDISIWIDGTELKNVNKALTTPSTTTAASVTHTLTITNFEETLKQSGKSYIEWSGNITLKIGGRGQATSTYSKNVLKDAYGNQSMSQTDTSGTWVEVNFKDSTLSSVNTSGKLFADVVNPSIIYEYANTTIDHTNQKVTVIFDVTDKYFNASTLTSDTTASKISMTIGATSAPDKATKKLTKLSDIKATIDGKADTKIGERYQLEVTNLDQGTGRKI